MSSLVALANESIFAGDYRIVSPLSSGGMGAVYVAEQLSTGTRRALKVMHPQLAGDTKLRERFVQEARVGSRIESDHVVQVVAAGVDQASGMPWLAMELLKGETLDALIRRRGALPRREVAELLTQLAHALSAAHDVGVVHRDLKPENVFLAAARRRDVAFTLKVLDFGIAKILAEVATQQTAAMGTPLWMAPEQTEAMGRITPATDVWALGLIAFQLLTGRSFWLVASAPEAPGALAVLREVVMDPLPRASERARALGVGHLVPDGFDEWFARCVCRDPSGRYPDARAAELALEPVLAASSSQSAVYVAPQGTLPSAASPARTQPMPLDDVIVHPLSRRAPTRTAPTLRSVIDGERSPVLARMPNRSVRTTALVAIGAVVLFGAIAAWVLIPRDRVVDQESAVNDLVARAERRCDGARAGAPLAVHVEVTGQATAPNLEAARLATICALAKDERFDVVPGADWPVLLTSHKGGLELRFELSPASYSPSLSVKVTLVAHNLTTGANGTEERVETADGVTTRSDAQEQAAYGRAIEVLIGELRSLDFSVQDGPALGLDLTAHGAQSVAAPAASEGRSADQLTRDARAALAAGKPSVAAELARESLGKGGSGSNYYLLGAADQEMGAHDAAKAAYVQCANSGCPEAAECRDLAAGLVAGDAPHVSQSTTTPAPSPPPPARKPAPVVKDDF